MDYLRNSRGPKEMCLKKEVNAKHAFDMFIQDLEAQTEAANEKYLADFVATCEQMASDFETRQQPRSEEIDGINKAIEIISEGGALEVERRCEPQTLPERVIASETSFRCRCFQSCSSLGLAAAVRWCADRRPRGTRSMWWSSVSVHSTPSFNCPLAGLQRPARLAHTVSVAQHSVLPHLLDCCGSAPRPAGVNSHTGAHRVLRDARGA